MSVFIKKFTPLLIIMFLFIGCGGGGSNSSIQKYSKNQVVKIMPLGDSITIGYSNKYANRPGIWTGYRAFLCYDLNDAGVKYDMVGTQRAGWDIRPEFDLDNEGYPGVTSFTLSNYVYKFLEEDNPDIVLLHIGSNDHANGRVDGTERILDEIKRYEKDHNKKITVFVALIINRWFWDRTIEKYNKNLKALLEKRNDPEVHMVDMSHLLVAPDDYLEDYHPNSQGQKKMADKWFTAIMDTLY